MQPLHKKITKTLYEPANYPVIRQVIIVSAGLLLIFSGLFFSRDSAEDHRNATASIASNTQETPDHFSGDTPKPILVNDDDIKALAAHVYDVRNDTVLYEKNATEPLPLASITKLMTALLVEELVEQQTTVTVTPEAVAQYGNSGLRVGERITAENLTRYALLSSSNDAAYALAVSIGEAMFPDEGSAGFIDAMNVRAAELELHDTQFQNPTGLDVSLIESGANGSARDVSRLMSYIVQEHRDLLKATQLPETHIYNETGEYHRAQNTNRLVTQIPQLLGSKTGFTDLAGGNLTIALDAGFNRPIIITVLGSSFAGRFEDVQTLINATQAAWYNDSE